VRRNIISNYAGAGWSAFVSFITIPFLLAILGAESYGLIALFLTIKTISQAFDFGLAVSSNREVAYRIGLKEKSVFDYIVTVEVMAWVLGIFLSTLIWLIITFSLKDLVSVKILRDDQLFMITILFCISLIGSWPVLLYQNVLRGLNDHVKFNVVLIVVSTLRNPGALLVLWFFSSTVQAYMIWFLMVSVFEVIVYRRIMNKRVKTLSPGIYGKFNFNSLQGMKGFALGAGVSSIFATLIYQSDKILISMYLDLVSVGYYSALLALVGIFGKLTTPIVKTVFPGMTAALSEGNTEGVVYLYVHFARLIANTLLPMMVTVIVFSNQILMLWLPEEADIFMLSKVLSALCIAYVFYSLANIPIIIHIVFKKVRLLVFSRVVALILLVPSLIYLIDEFKLLGAAVGVLVCSILLYFILIISVSRRLFPGHVVGHLRMLLHPLLITVVIFILLQIIKQFFTENDLIQVVSCLFGLTMSYILIFRRLSSKLFRRVM